MKKSNNKFWVVLVIVLVALGLGLAYKYHYDKRSKSTVFSTGTANLSLSPSSGTYSGNFTVDVLENSSQQTNAVQFNLNYDTSALKVSKISYGGSAGSPFTLCPIAQTGSASGQIVVACAIPGNGLTGSQKVASISFDVLKAESTSLAFASGSSIIRTSDRQNIWNGKPNTVSYILSSSD